MHASRTAQVSSSPREPSGLVFSSIARCAAAAIMRRNLLADELRRLLDDNFRLAPVQDDLPGDLDLVRHELIDVGELAGVLLVDVRRERLIRIGGAEVDEDRVEARSVL